MTTRFDDDPEFAPDDPLAVILRPPAEHLGPPPGHYETIRRAAGRRRMLRAAVGAGVTCAVAALVALPVYLTAPQSPTTPAPPLAPPPATSRTTAPPVPSAVPTPSASPTPTTPRGTDVAPSTRPGRTQDAATPTSRSVPSAAPSRASTATPARPTPSADADADATSGATVSSSDAARP